MSVRHSRYIERRQTVCRVFRSFVLLSIFCRCFGCCSGVLECPAHVYVSYCSIISVDSLTIFLFGWMTTLFLNEIAQKSIICVFFGYSIFLFHLFVLLYVIVHTYRCALLIVS